MECDSIMPSRRRRFQIDENCLRRSSLFFLYAKIFRLLLSKCDKANLDGDEDAYGRELERLVLPSNEEWRLRVYYRLVELQRDSDSHSLQEPSAIAGVEDPEKMQLTQKPKADWEPDVKASYPLTARCRSKGFDFLDSVNVSISLDACVEPGWKLRDVLLAAKLLANEQPCQQLEYADEAEMRRVYGLVYDVLRYKFILARALDDVGFWLRYSHLKKREKVVWLLLYDMQGRKFASGRRSSKAFAQREETFREAGLLETEEALLAKRTRLAASLSRLRIGGSALSLDELLPAHLRTAEGVTWAEVEGAIASGWVNSAKVPSRRHFVEEMSGLGLRLCSSCPTGELNEDQYTFDPLCPKFVNLHEKARERLASSQLVLSHAFVFLERSLCVGASVMVQAIKVGKLCGPVILTHPRAPRHTAYLAQLLVDVEEAGPLLVFGLTPYERDQHQAYLKRLGIPPQRCKLFADKYTAQRPSSGCSSEIERATVVLAAPPCSCTGLRDVVDLAIARGGDLRLLESLTRPESEPAQPHALLAEQLASLRFALTRPNVQLLVYEVQTLLPSETTEMIQQAVEYANKMALDKHQHDHPSPKKKSSVKESGKRGKRKRSLSVEQLPSKRQQQQNDTKASLELDEESPEILESDLFEMTNLSDLYEQDCRRLMDPGSFIVIVKRKEMMQFNSLFMIKVAEAKGVFGEPTKQLAKSPEPVEQQLQQRQQIARPSVQKKPAAIVQKRHKRHKVEFERLTAPTYATIMRVLQDKQLCPRHQQHLVHEESTVESQKKSPDSDPITDPLPTQLITNCDSQTSLKSTANDSEEDVNSDADSCSPTEETVKSKVFLNNSKLSNGDSGEPEYQLPFRRLYNEDFKKLHSRSLSADMPDLFNISFKPMHLQLRRRNNLQLRSKRLNRISFQSRLETVYEHSQSFSYLFPEI